MPVNDLIQSPYSLIVTMAFELQYAAKKSGKGNDLRSAMDLGQHWERRNHSTLTTGHYIVLKCHVCVGACIFVYVQCVFVCVHECSKFASVCTLLGCAGIKMHAQCN